MNLQTNNLRYIPLAELITFSFSVIGLTCLLLFSDLNEWLYAFALLALYFKIIGSAKIISLRDDKLKVISLNPIFGSHTVDLSDLLSINSYDNLRQKKDITSKTSYYEFNRQYNVEYKSRKGYKKNVTFFINSLKKERAIIEKLRASLNSNTPNN